MRVWIIIPARFQSSRYPGKPLVVLKGRDGDKTLIRRTWETGRAVPGVERVIVATDSDEIAAHVTEFGGEVQMTGVCANGTERCADAVARIGDAPDLVVNLQGDAPLTPPWFLEDLIAAMAARPDVGAATPVLKCDAATWRALREDRAADRVGGTTAVFDAEGRALYFSKEVIPYLPAAAAEDPPVYHHVGVYAYRPRALADYATWPPGRLEQLEGLEQLRFVERGVPMLCVEVEARGRVFWELNNPVDVARIEAVL
jgi:3-deoxy-manno-octulosonate cytidylyltransferase (CMP-KDO synthetase)